MLKHEEVETVTQVEIDEVCMTMHICDMIKRNESDVGDAVFEILTKTGFKYLCFILFLALSNPA